MSQETWNRETAETTAGGVGDAAGAADADGAERCPVCGRIAATGAEGAGPVWVLLSAHRTSEGELEYCACVCGCVLVLLNGHIVKRHAT